MGKIPLSISSIYVYLMASGSKLNKTKPSKCKESLFISLRANWMKLFVLPICLSICISSLTPLHSRIPRPSVRHTFFRLSNNFLTFALYVAVLSVWTCSHFRMDECIVSDCSGHGNCDRGDCVCHPGWTGEDCSTSKTRSWHTCCLDRLTPSVY